MSGNATDRYRYRNLFDLMSDALTQDCMFFLSAEISIPVGNSVPLRATIKKPGSYTPANFKSSDNRLYGYDIISFIESGSPFDTMSAEIINYNNLGFARQNFGFDPRTGVAAVTLDKEIEHYYMDMRAITEQMH